MKIGDKFYINTLICEDTDLLDWYHDQDIKLLTANEISKEVNGVWVKECPFRIDLDEIISEKSSGEAS